MLVPNNEDSSGFSVNNVILNITGGTISTTDTIWEQDCVNNINNSTVAITGGTIAGITKIDSTSTVNISGAQTRVAGILNYGTVTATAGATFTDMFTNYKIATFENVTISSSNQNALKIDGGTQTDVKEGTVIEHTNTGTSESYSAIRLENSSSKCTIFEGATVTSTYSTAIYNNGKLTLGNNELPVSTSKPAITGAVYGINNNGTFNFYDGLITGTGNRALTGTDPASLPTDYAVQISDNATSAWLESSAASTNVAKVNGVSYKSLQSAINATTTGTITILSRITLQEPIIIPSGKNIVIDLKSYSIEYSGEEATIENNGTLTIVDSNEDGTSTQNYGIVENKVGPAIQNNGTLTIGSDGDSTIYKNSPRIVGKTYAVVNASGATFSFYDGVLKGVSATVSGTITNYSTITGYTYTTGSETVGGVTYQIAYYNAD